MPKGIDTIGTIAPHPPVRQNCIEHQNVSQGGWEVSPPPVRRYCIHNQYLSILTNTINTFYRHRHINGSNGINGFLYSGIEDYQYLAMVSIPAIPMEI